MKKGFKKLLSLCMVIETVFSSIPMVHAEELEKTISSPVLITEIVPNTDNMNKLDAYEYYELMNISDQDVNLSDYNIVYVNDTKTSIWKTNVQVLPAGEKMLVWTRNEGNTELTKADFIAYYGLAEDAFIAEVKCDGLANSKRGLAITDSNGNVLLSTTYNSEDSQNGTIDINEAIVFTYNGNDITLKYDQLPSPLHVEEECIVGEYVAPKQDENEDQPTINPDESQDENIDQSKAPVLLISEIIPDTTN
ncbi:MAG: lamin tail domain-containing protein, partial [Longicatena sp.]|nr:lamin tail domain-containing protein [Longicatena sp.]